MRLSQEDPSVPIVLICENGAKSCLLSTELQAKGFINVFFLEGGMVSYKD